MSLADLSMFSSDSMNTSKINSANDGNISIFSNDDMYSTFLGDSLVGKDATKRRGGNNFCSNDSMHSRFSDDPFVGKDRTEVTKFNSANDDNISIFSNISMQSRFSDDPLVGKDVVVTPSQKFRKSIYIILNRKVGSRTIVEGTSKAAKELEHGAIVSSIDKPRKTNNSAHRCALTLGDQREFIYGQWYDLDEDKMSTEREGYFSPSHGYCIAYWHTEPNKKLKAYWKQFEKHPGLMDWKLAMFKNCMLTWNERDLPRDDDMEWVMIDGQLVRNPPTAYESFMTPTLSGIVDNPNIEKPTMISPELAREMKSYLRSQKGQTVDEQINREADCGDASITDQDAPSSSSEEFEFNDELVTKKTGGGVTHYPISGLVRSLVQYDNNAQHKRMLDNSLLTNEDDLCEKLGDYKDNFSDDDTVNQEDLKSDIRTSHYFDECADEVNSEIALKELEEADEKCWASEPSYMEARDMDRKKREEEIDKHLFTNVDYNECSPCCKNMMKWLKKNERT